jgi:hypothetical protein
MNRTIRVSNLVLGLVFMGIAALWALRTQHAVDRPDVHWALAAILLGAGVVGLVASIVNDRVRRRTPSPAAPPAYDDTTPVTDLTSDLDRRLAEHESQHRTSPEATDIQPQQPTHNETEQNHE